MSETKMIDVSFKTYLKHQINYIKKSIKEITKSLLNFFKSGLAKIFMFKIISIFVCAIGTYYQHDLIALLGLIGTITGFIGVGIYVDYDCWRAKRKIGY